MSMRSPFEILLFIIIFGFYNFILINGVQSDNMIMEVIAVVMAVIIIALYVIGGGDN